MMSVELGHKLGYSMSVPMEMAPMDCMDSMPMCDDCGQFGYLTACQGLHFCGQCLSSAESEGEGNDF